MSLEGGDVAARATTLSEIANPVSPDGGPVEFQGFRGRKFWVGPVVDQLGLAVVDLAFGPTLGLGELPVSLREPKAPRHAVRRSRLTLVFVGWWGGGYRGVWGARGRGGNQGRHVGAMSRIVAAMSRDSRVTCRDIGRTVALRFALGSPLGSTRGILRALGLHGLHGERDGFRRRSSLGHGPYQ